VVVFFKKKRNGSVHFQFVYALTNDFRVLAFSLQGVVLAISYYSLSYLFECCLIPNFQSNSILFVLKRLSIFNKFIKKCVTVQKQNKCMVPTYFVVDLIKLKIGVFYCKFG
jgi:hypothetical protein